MAACGLAQAQGPAPSAQDDVFVGRFRPLEFTMFRKILVPLDGSPTSQRGLEEAIMLAKATGAGLRLVHVIEPVPVAADMMTAGVWGALIAGQHEAGEQLLAKASAAAEQQGVSSTRQVLELPGERVADAILNEAKAAGADLIVMGTHGRRGLIHALMGSVAESVARTAPCSVLVVR